MPLQIIFFHFNWSELCQKLFKKHLDNLLSCVLQIESKLQKGESIRTMKVFVDGKEIKCKNDVKIIHEVENDELHITCTHEGVITDIVSNNNIVGTSSIEAQDVYDTLMAGHDPMCSKNGDEDDFWGA